MKPVSTRSTSYDIEAIRPIEAVIAIAAIEHVVAGPAIVLRITVDRVIASPPPERIIPGDVPIPIVVPPQQVIAAISLNPVVSRVAFDFIIRTAADQSVIAIPSVETHSLRQGRRIDQVIPSPGIDRQRAQAIEGEGLLAGRRRVKVHSTDKVSAKWQIMGEQASPADSQSQ